MLTKRTAAPATNWGALSMKCRGLADGMRGGALAKIATAQSADLAKSPGDLARMVDAIAKSFAELSTALEAWATRKALAEAGEGGFRLLNPISPGRMAEMARENALSLWTRALSGQAKGARAAIEAARPDASKAAGVDKLGKVIMPDKLRKSDDDAPNASDGSDDTSLEELLAALAAVDFGLDAAQRAAFTRYLAEAAGEAARGFFMQVTTSPPPAGPTPPSVAPPTSSPPSLTIRTSMFEQLDARAAAWAKNHAAETMTGIADTTRAAVREAIVNGIEGNLSIADIGKSIENLDVFGADRAQIIAETEIRGANSQGALVGYKQARDNGVMVLKRWLVANGEGVCDECADNAAQGPIDLDSPFASGDDAPPAHPNCRCAIAPAVAWKH